MRQPCEYGFNCPYRAYSDDLEIICTYPYIKPEEGETYGYAQEGDCALMDYGSELHDILLAYQESDKIQKDVVSVVKTLDEESEKLVREFRERRLKL